MRPSPLPPTQILLLSLPTRQLASGHLPAYHSQLSLPHLHPILLARQRQHLRQLLVKGKSLKMHSLLFSSSFFSPSSFSTSSSSFSFSASFQECIFTSLGITHLLTSHFFSPLCLTLLQYAASIHQRYWKLFIHCCAWARSLWKGQDLYYVQQVFFNLLPLSLASFSCSCHLSLPSFSLFFSCSSNSFLFRCYLRRTSILRS